MLISKKNFFHFCFNIYYYYYFLFNWRQSIDNQQC